MDKAGSLNEMYATWQLLRRTQRVVGKARQKELDEIGISGDAVAVMSTVLQLGRDAIPAEIARQLLCEPNSVSQLITRLEKDGLARRVRDLDIKNLVRVELTKQGIDVHRKAMVRRSIRKMMSSLTEQEREQLWNALAKLREAAIREIGWKKITSYPPSDRSELFCRSEEGRPAGEIPSNSKPDSSKIRDLKTSSRGYGAVSGRSRRLRHAATRV